jgi:hypothetical protein
VDDLRGRSVWRSVADGALAERSIGFLPAADGIDLTGNNDGQVEPITWAAWPRCRIGFGRLAGQDHDVAVLVIGG